MDGTSVARAGGAALDKMRLDAHLSCRRVRLGDAAHEQFHGVVADGALVAADGGQRHGHVDLGLYVVKADDGHVLRHAHAARGEGAEHLPGDVI